VLVVLKFLIFFLYIFLLGRSLFLVTNNKRFQKEGDLLKVFNTPLFLFYPLFGFIIIGNIAFLLHFFIPINNYLVIYITIVLILFNFKKIPNFQLSKVFSLLSLGTILYLPLSSYGIGLSYDAGLYHLNYQSWLQSSKVVLGLSNFHMRFGYSSIFDYISVNFWMNNNFLFIHFLNLISICFFILFILYNILDKDNNLFLKSSSIGILIMGLLDNFGFNGGKNGFIEIEGVTKYDGVFAVFFYLTVLLAFLLLINDQASNFEINFLILFSVFTLQLRPTGVLVIFPVLIVIFKYKKIKEIISDKIILILILLLAIWLFKNVLVSGCLLFPIEILCFDSLSWYSKNYALTETLNIRDSLRAYNYDMPLSDWFEYWTKKNSYNLASLKNFVFAYVIIFIYKIIFYKTKNTLYFKIGITYSVFLFVFWISTAPDLRFAIGFFILMISLIFIDVTGYRFSNKIRFHHNYLVIILFALSTLLIPRINSVTLALYDPFENIKIEAPDNTLYVNKGIGFGVQANDLNEQCWINIDCAPPYSLPTKLDNLLGYKVFTFINN
jgi:hypothetical protein